MRAFIVLILAALLINCGPAAAPPAETAHRDPTAEPWYGQAVSELAGMNSEANALFQHGKKDAAAALIVKGEPLRDRLLRVTNPTLAAMEAASDLDELYGQMLLSNHNYGWARLLFQKNVARWRYWKPQTPETASRLKRARDEIAECDRKMSQ